MLILEEKSLPINCRKKQLQLMALQVIGNFKTHLGLICTHSIWFRLQIVALEYRKLYISKVVGQPGFDTWQSRSISLCHYV